MKKEKASAQKKMQTQIAGTNSADRAEKEKIAKEKYEKFLNDFEKKVYLVSGGKKTAQYLMEFIKNDVKWTAHECLGVVKIYEDLQKAVKENEKQLFLSALCIEAIAYFISKVENKGLDSAVEFKDNIFMPINEAMAKIREDKKQLEQLQKEWAATASGIKLEGETENQNTKSE